jgi:hypothetical protein
MDRPRPTQRLPTHTGSERKQLCASCRDTWGGSGLERARDGGDGDVVQERLERFAPALPCRLRPAFAACGGFARCFSRHLPSDLCAPGLWLRCKCNGQASEPFALLLQRLSVLLQFRERLPGHVCGCAGTDGAYQDTCCVWICPVVVLRFRFWLHISSTSSSSKVTACADVRIFSGLYNLDLDFK